LVSNSGGHVKQDHGMQRCWLKGSEGDALHAVLCAAGYNLRWLLRAIARKGLRALFAPVLWLAVMAEWLVTARNHSRHHVAMASN
jgi:IS5 family transposase